ncbi:MAG TPA: ABC transporter permease subunit [Thermoanaerobaculia bacterium]|nr:ABC transporter permease subunit [Thermoanaerobaculia bacterium]
MKRSLAGFLLCLPLLVFLALAFLVPLAHLVPESLHLTPGLLAPSPPASSASTAAISAANFRRAVAGEGFRAFANSVLLSAAVAIVSLVICLPAAWMLARHRFPGQGLLRTVLALPLTFSGVIVGFLAILVLGRIGLLPALLGLLTGKRLLAGSAYTLAGLAASYVYFEVPRAVLTLEAALRRLNPELEDAAATLGATPIQSLLRISLPQLRPAMVSTLAVTFAASMGSFGVALVLARQLTVVPLEIYTQYTGFLDTGYAAALCLILAVVTLAANMLLRKSSGSGEWMYG